MADKYVSAWFDGWKYQKVGFVQKTHAWRIKHKSTGVELLSGFSAGEANAKNTVGTAIRGLIKTLGVEGHLIQRVPRSIHSPVTVAEKWRLIDAVREVDPAQRNYKQAYEFAKEHNDRLFRQAKALVDTEIKKAHGPTELFDMSVPAVAARYNRGRASAMDSVAAGRVSASMSQLEHYPVSFEELLEHDAHTLEIEMNWNGVWHTDRPNWREEYLAWREGDKQEQN